MTRDKLRRRPARDGWRPPRVMEIREGSPCSGEVRPGDLLARINGRAPQDILDYMDASSQGRVSLRLLRDGSEISRVIRKHPGVPLGLVFDEPVFDGMRKCRNRCIFCFVDQMPQGLRRTLYLKDDDYRLSFYYGNFITLNNLSGEDMARIKAMRIAPLYVSLHSTDPELREHIMGGNAGGGLDALGELIDAGLEMHLQVVVCPGINDGGQLLRTFADVLERYTATSLGVVPVGLSARVRALNPELRAHDRKSAREVLETVSEFQGYALERYGRRLFYAADEFYQLAGEDFPAAEEYEEYPQLENGVGMARKFMDEADEAAGLIAAVCGTPRGIVTGAAGAAVIRRVLPWDGREKVEIVTARNRLFGEAVTVTALLGGGDIIAALGEEMPAARELLIPGTLLRDGRFIDDLTLEDVERESGYRLLAVEVDGAALMGALYGNEGGG